MITSDDLHRSVLVLCTGVCILCLVRFCFGTEHLGVAYKFAIAYSFAALVVPALGRATRKIYGRQNDD